MEAMLVIVFALSLWQHELLFYGILQAQGQLNIVWNAKNIDEVIHDKAFPDSLKQKLVLIQEIRKFAVDSLGVNNSDNYTTVYNQQGKPLLWVLTASYPYKMKAKQWHFPVLGNVPYKGFFVRERSIREMIKLKMEDYDTDVGRVGGWSTLGWFKDPILSNMLYNSDGALANLIIHELTHATLYVKDDVDFNENLATFVGDKGALRFLEYKYGKASQYYREYIQDKKDEDVFDHYMLQSASRLDSLYKTFADSDERDFKENRKHIIISDIVKGIYLLPLYDKIRYRRLGKKIFLTQNAFFMSYVHYESKQTIFEKEYTEKFNSDIKKYLIYLKGKYHSV